MFYFYVWQTCLQYIIKLLEFPSVTEFGFCASAVLATGRVQQKCMNFCLILGRIGMELKIHPGTG